MSEPSQGQRVADGPDPARLPNATGSGNGAALRPPDLHSVDAVDLFTDLAAACVPTFCDGLHVDLTADGANGLSASFPPDGAPSGDGAGDAVSLDGHARHRSFPGRIIIGVHTELAAGEPPVVGTITCTWNDPIRPTEADVLVARLLADQAAARLRLDSLDTALQKQLTRARNLEEALTTNREIGQAIGILMATHHVTAEQAFEQLRTASQHTHRKLREIAADVAETGALPLAAVHASTLVRSAGRADGRVERHHTQRIQRRTRGGQPVAATPDEA